MAHIELEDALRPTDDIFKKFYEKAYQTWHKLLVDAAEDHTLPPECLQWEHLFPDHPVFPVGLEPDATGFLTAKTTWVSSQGHCDIPAFEQYFQRSIAGGSEPTPILLTNDSDLSLSEWFGQGDKHLAILMLAWTYALSARWAEIIPRASPMEYTMSQAPWIDNSDPNKPVDGGDIVVFDLGELTFEAARWWAAILAPGEGWKVSLPHAKWQVLSPWSVTTKFNNTKVFLSGCIGPMDHSSPTAASFETSLKYIDEYTALHNAGQQSRAGLAAALLLPVARWNRRNKITLNVPRGLHKSFQHTDTPRPALFDKHCLRQFDKLLTLSTNFHGVKAVLGSIFYQPGIPANVCGAWLQGTMAVLKSKEVKKLRHLSRIFFDRSPHISFLWLGAIITGAHKDFVQSVHGLLGFNRIDLHAAAWTGTVVSFIQEPVHSRHGNSKLISQADECRLMFLSQEPPKDLLPIYPYPPFGETDIKDTDLGVQLHAHCPAKHQLQFVSIAWLCSGGRKEIQTTGFTPLISHDYSIINSYKNEGGASEVDYTWLDRERDLSAKVTRNLFLWMRDMDGYTVAERDILRHEWIDAFGSDSDDEVSADPEGDGKSTMGQDDAWVGRWLADSMTRRCNSL
ncbi:hypothetical protein FPOA_06410 [Fusarium poae]|uniref:Uncharacterized protein n=1 Tax=Fusarium poae TaxID=36050 RepID=A0A1B8AZM9_FUSPO|nr:hypothetical protein FPOA_06410 [Fusarium poae]